MKAQNMRRLVLFVSENADLYMLLAHILNKEGFRTALVSEDEVLERAAAGDVTALILDSAEGSDLVLRVCAAIKASDRTSQIPTVAIVPSGDERHYLALLKAGIDENFVRPISPARLLAYLDSLNPFDTSDHHPTDEAQETKVTIGPLRVEARRRLVSHGDSEVQFGPIEFNILSRLLHAPGRVCSRSELIEAAWPGGRYVQPRTVDVHVGRLRRALERLTGRTLIRTIRSTGYAIELDNTAGGQR